MYQTHTKIKKLIILNDLAGMEFVCELTLNANSDAKHVQMIP